MFIINVTANKLAIKFLTVYVYCFYAVLQPFVVINSDSIWHNWRLLIFFIWRLICHRDYWPSRTKHVSERFWYFNWLFHVLLTVRNYLKPVEIQTITSFALFSNGFISLIYVCDVYKTQKTFYQRNSLKFAIASEKK